MQSLKIRITEEMVRDYSVLTGDMSSLHTKSQYAREVLYRKNVVHGMLPLVFLCAFQFGDQKERVCLLESMTARFTKPIYVGDELSLSVERLDEDVAQNVLEYVIEREGVVLTTGSITLRRPAESLSCGEADDSPRDDQRESMLEGVLKERDVDIDEIDRGDEERFSFKIAHSHLDALRRIISNGDVGIADKVRMSEGMALQLMPASMLSTMVGMRLPGRRATFLDLSLNFDSQIELHQHYDFIACVKHVSKNMNIIKESIAIVGSGNGENVLLRGGANVGIGESSMEMPSIKEIMSMSGDMGLRDKVVLITGASRGIGATTARLLSLFGAKIVVNYFRGKDDAETLVREICEHGGTAVAMQCDVSDRSSVRAMIADVTAKCGPVDVLINNATKDYVQGKFAELSWKDVQDDIDVNVKGSFNCCQEVLPSMVKRGGGRIINISTLAAETPPKNHAKYVIAKNALVGLTRSIAIEYAPHNVLVNMVVPSLVQTDLTKHIPQMFIRDIERDTPMQRTASALDVARSILYLSSSMCSFTTGQKLMVTGGSSPLM